MATKINIKTIALLTAVVLVVLIVGGYILKLMNLKTMKLNEKGLAFLAAREGFKPNAYQDSVGVWTIGYGNTFYADGSSVKPGDTITEPEAKRLFHLVVKDFERCVNRKISAPLTQNQFNALVSLCYNIGCDAFKNSTLAKLVNDAPNNQEAIANAFLAWRYSGGQPILLSRREKEVDLYFTNSIV